MTGIWEFPKLDELESYIENLFELATDDLEDELNENEARFISLLSYERAIITDGWGNGTATIGGDPLEVLVIVSLPGSKEEHLVSGFNQKIQKVRTRMVELAVGDGPTAPQEALNAFTDFNVTVAGSSQILPQTALAMGKGEENSIFDLTAKERLNFKEGVTSYRNYPRTPLDELIETEEDTEEIEEDEEEPEEPEETEPEVDEEPEELDEPEEEKSLEDRFEPDFPEINPQLREFAVSENQLNIPAGSETKRVEPREPYKFELMMGLPLTQLQQRSLIGVGEDPRRQLNNGVGIVAGLGQGSPQAGLGITAPPSTFPRTSSYIRNRLLFEGPTYVLNLYRDLVVYSGFISGFYDMTMKPGGYDSFRNFMNRLQLITERGGPELIRPLSQQEVASRGNSVVPDHPTLEDEKAPWLNNREYYKIMERNKDHEAWDDPTKYLYEELEPVSN